MALLAGCTGPGQGKAPEKGDKPKGQAQVVRRGADSGDMVKIPSGKLIAGSRPDQEGKDHKAEPDEEEFPIDAFEMDRLPYPDDPNQPPRLGVSQTEAERLCEEKSKRLCTDLEWERACKGNENRIYPSGNAYDPQIYEGLGPESGYGVLGMGRIGEWTMTRWTEAPVEEGRPVEIVIRGAAPKVGDAATRRCARRTSADPGLPIDGVGFRCCRGKANPAEIQAEQPHGPWRELPFIDADKMAAIFRTVPELSGITAPRLFSPDDLRLALLRGSTDPKEFPDFLFTNHPLRWTPVPGLDLWVFVGISGTNSFVAALYKYQTRDRFLQAASLTFLETPAPLMLVAKKGHREEIWWGFCWGCRESGTIRLDEKGSVVITHKW